MYDRSRRNQQWADWSLHEQMPSLFIQPMSKQQQTDPEKRLSGTLVALISMTRVSIPLLKHVLLGSRCDTRKL